MILRMIADLPGVMLYSAMAAPATGDAIGSDGFRIPVLFSNAIIFLLLTL
jgi:hypothetical protein